MGTVDYDIVIPTRGRIGRQRTLEFMSPELRKRTILVGPADEYQRHIRYPYMEGVRFLQQPDPNMTIAAKRAWLLRVWGGQVLVDSKFSAEAPRGFSQRMLMFDDDLRFYIRRDDVPDRLRYAEAADQEVWFGELANQLSEKVPHAGFGPRQGNDKQPDGWQEPGRMMFALGYHVPTVIANCELGRIETREDFDLSLQLLLHGLPNRVCHTFVCGQASYNEAGGASLERTLERSNADAQRLAEIHAGHVRVVSKDYKGHPRLEVVIQWRRALETGRKWRQSQAAGREDS